MPSRRKFKPKFVANALKANMGMVYITARKIGCSHQMIYNYIDEFEECRQAYEEQSGFMIDAAESQFYAAIRRGEPWAINKMLSTKGRTRGYIEKQELETKGRVEIVVKREHSQLGSHHSQSASETNGLHAIDGQAQNN